METSRNKERKSKRRKGRRQGFIIEGEEERWEEIR
jgi:hypothetical protein